MNERSLEEVGKLFRLGEAVDEREDEVLVRLHATIDDNAEPTDQWVPRAQLKQFSVGDCVRVVETVDNHMKVRFVRLEACG